MHGLPVGQDDPIRPLDLGACYPSLLIQNPHRSQINRPRATVAWKPLFVPFSGVITPAVFIKSLGLVRSKLFPPFVDSGSPEGIERLPGRGEQIGVKRPHLMAIHHYLRIPL